jgi:hypothetical protein
MRSWDYRADQVGISLYILKPFAHERDEIQGLNRVGRFKDKSERIKLQGMETVDLEQQHKYYAQLNGVHLDKVEADE